MDAGFNSQAGLDDLSPSNLRDASGVNYLTERLPFELQGMIWQAVFISGHRDGSKITTNPICKALLPYQQSLLFHSLLVYRLPDLNRLASVISSNPVLGAVCCQFTFLVCATNANGEAIGGESTECLRTILNAMERVKMVELQDHSPEVLDWVVKKQLAPSALERMSYLKLCNPLGGQGEAQWELESYKALGQYPSLFELVLNFHDDVIFHPPATDLPTIVPPYLANITFFRLHGYIDMVRAAQFVRSMPHLCDLWLGSYSLSPVKFAAVIQAAPSTLRSLEITGDQEAADGGVQTDFLIDSSIAHLTQLKEFSLGTPLFSSHLFRHLADPLPLKKITFGYTISPTINEQMIIDLISLNSATANTSLEEVVIDVVEGAIGDKVAEDGLDAYGIPILEDWDIPNFQASQFTCEGMLLILELGKARGVKISGTAVQAVEVQKAVEREKARASEMTAAAAEEVES